MPVHPDDHLARALAWGFLAAPEWTERALVSAGHTTLGRRHRWLPRVVRPVLASYRSAPLDRPSELTGFLLVGTPLPQVSARARQQRRPLRVQTVATVSGRIGVRRWPVPEVDDLAGLATLLELPLDQLTWAADARGLQRRTPPGPLHLYRHHWVARAGAVPRLLESPTPLLRAVLRRVLDRILCWVPLHPAVHGFVRGRSALTNARLHLGPEAVVCLDLQTFFASITTARVNGLFTAMGYSEAVAWTLTGLCSHQTPVHVLRRMPPGGDSTARYRLRAELRNRHLPQGAPTSPALANLTAFGLDRRLAGYAIGAGLTYSRYADDLTFSGPDVATPRLIRAVTEIARAEGFVINSRKTRIRFPGQRRTITGLVVSGDRLGVPREYHDRLRAILHDAAVNGPEVANRGGLPHFRAHLEGRVGWVESVSAVRGRRLRAQLDAISWPD
ncbi:MAG TPA: reverse transcriptase family protein [Microlunatus sp.]